jgi:hypothetical protein
MKRWVTAFAGMAVLASADVGFAANEAAALELSWLSPPECPTGKVIRDEAVRLASADGRPLPSVRAKVTVQRDESDYVLTLTTGAAGPNSIQTFRAGTCRAVAQAAAVTLALLLNPAGASHSSAGPEQAPQSRRASAREPSRPIRAAAIGLVGAQFGLLPKIGPTFGAELGIYYGPASVWLGGAYGPLQRTMLEGQPNVGGELALGQAMLYGCWALTARSPRLNLCAGLDFSRVSGHGVGVTDQRVGTIYWLSALGGAAAEVAVHPNIVLRAGAFAATPFSHPAAFVADAGDVHRPATVTANLHAGLGGVWP